MNVTIPHPTNSMPSYKFVTHQTQHESKSCTRKSSYVQRVKFGDPESKGTTNHTKHSLLMVLVAEFISSVWYAYPPAWSADHMPQVLVPVPLARLAGGRQLGRDPGESFANKHQAVVVAVEVGSMPRWCTQNRTCLNENLTELCAFQWTSELVHWNLSSHVKITEKRRWQIRQYLLEEPIFHYLPPWYIFKSIFGISVGFVNPETWLGTLWVLENLAIELGRLDSQTLHSVEMASRFPFGGSWSCNSWLKWTEVALSEGLKWKWRLDYHQMVLTKQESFDNFPCD